MTLMFFKCRAYNSSMQPMAVFAAVALLATTAALVRAVVPADDRLFAEVVVDADLLRASSGLEPDFDFDLRREAAFITGSAVLEAALRRPETAGLEIVRRHPENAVAWLARRVRVDFPGANIVRITFIGKRTEEGACLVNAVAAAYVDEMLAESERLRAERIALLVRGQRDVAQRLSEKREAISRLETLLAARGPQGVAETAGGAGLNDTWQRELSHLKIAVTQGQDMELRLTAELARLRTPQDTGVAVRHRAAL
jgi:hypothetical protein